MKESEEARMGEIAEEWGCKVTDEVDFYRHYTDYKNKKSVLLALSVFLGVLVFLVLLVG